MNDKKMINDRPSQNDRFDEFLRQQLQSDYLDDNGFTAHLMAALPVQKRLNPWLEKAIIALPVALIAWLVFRHLPWRDFVQPVYAWILLLDMSSLLSLAAVIFIALVVAPVAWLLSGDS